MIITSSFTGQFQQRILEAIRANHLIENGDRVVVGVSGGADSVCLLHVLHSLSRALQIKLYAVHINHMLRADEADGDERYTADLCEELGIQLSSTRIDVGAMSKSLGISLEEAGRKARYGEFSRCAQAVGASVIAVAHNRNDQAETVMMNIMRGSGIAGLSGMEYKKGKIIRPLLDISRDEIERYCTEAGLSPRTDSSNLTEEFTRNRVRLGLFPYIMENFGINMEVSLCRLSAHAAKDNSFLDECASKAYLAALNVKQKGQVKGKEQGQDQGQDRRQDQGGGKGQVELNAEKLMSLHPAVLNRVLKLAITDVAGSSKGIASVHYQSLTDLIVKGRTGAIAELPGGIRGVFAYGVLKIFISHSDYSNSEDINFCVDLNIPGTVRVPELEATVTACIVRDTNIDNYPQLVYNPFMQFFDYDKLNRGIIIRNRRMGDRFAPFGSNGTKKLKEYFIDSKVPREQRSMIPLICMDDEIVWVIGDKISDKFKVTENTKSILRIKYSGGFHHDGGY